MGRGILFAILVAALVGVAALPVRAAPGDLDTSFGQDGYATYQVNKACLQGCVEFGGSYADALALEPDGKIVLGGFNEYLGAFVHGGASEIPGELVRLQSNGSLDPSFGDAGVVDDTFLRVNEVIPNARGGLLAIGEGARGTGLQRYTPNGVLDGEYGSAGVRWLPQGAEGQRDTAGLFTRFVEVRVAATEYEPSTTRLDVRRLLPSGELDDRFGHGGYAALPGSEGAMPSAVVSEPHGGVLVAFRLPVPSPYAPNAKAGKLVLERLTASGTLDRSFGTHRLARPALPADLSGVVVAIHDRHIIIAFGERDATRDLSDRATLALAELTHAGRLDRHFGKAGVARSVLALEGGHLLGASPHAIAYDRAGNAIVAGRLSIPTVDTPAGVAFLARYTPAGRDCSFGTHGAVIDESLGTANAVALQPNGRIILAGGLGRFVAARYMGGGVPRTCRGEGALYVHSRAGRTTGIVSGQDVRPAPTGPHRRRSAPR